MEHDQRITKHGQQIQEHVRRQVEKTLIPSRQQCLQRTTRKLPKKSLTSLNRQQKNHRKIQRSWKMDKHR